MAHKIEVFTSPTCPHCPGAVKVVEEAKAKLGDEIEVQILSIADPANRDLAIDYGVHAVSRRIIRKIRIIAKTIF